MNPQIQENANHNLTVNSKSAYVDMDGCVRMQEPLNDDEKHAIAKHLKNNSSKFKYMKPRSENVVAAELISYYQRKDKLLQEPKGERTALNYTSTLTHYNEKIIDLSKELDELNSERLQKIKTQRANDTTVNGAEILKH